MGRTGPVEMAERDSLRTSYSVSGTCGSPCLVARVPEREAAGGALERLDFSLGWPV